MSRQRLRPLYGARRYCHQRAEIEDICRGLERSPILRKFKTAGQLRDYLETMSWQCGSTYLSPCGSEFIRTLDLFCREYVLQRRCE